MKFYILLITFCLLAIATTQLNSQQITIDLLSGSCTTQSSFSDSTLNNSCANGENINSTNKSITQNILTKPENFPWWKTDLGNVAIMDTLYIYELFGGVSICIHNDEIKIVLTSLTSGELSLNEVCIDNCAFALQVVYEANSAIVPTNFTIQIFDNTNTLFFEPESFTLETLPNGRIRHLFEISGPILADLEESTFTVQMHPKVHEGYCEIGNCDLFLDAEIIIPKNRFLKVPNVYIPNGSNTTNQLFSPFFSHDSPEGGVYWVEMSIWDSNGSLIYLNELQALPSCTSLYGYEGDETGFPWNGHVNNNTGNNCGPFNNDSCLCAIGVYTYKIKYRNCLQQWQVEGTVTLIY